ncbi:DUF1257 domain-containing protein [Nostocaceae cyanobacterium CENA369]|uniref:DUF1257 domain-containing protein n=1 Tax=Dendronalium phyllosphericum CENA369 TaxID=1725256 RepID=A0A8J7I7W6_9NOST|nr:DUF1257 domain-containing protein [Dendronalium phyllosphericum]MBH8577154.1 DUF1257 domain-containing protein [Dendronalium phyllosphericum CENA369]
MSHFSKILVKFKDQSCLVEALQRFGFYPQIHDKPVNLYGYRGDKREQTAHIVVPRNQISSLSNDLGFYWNGTEYECLISEYDQGTGLAKAGLGLGQNFLSKLQQEYINLYLPKLCTLLGGEVVETVTHGSVTTVRVSLPTQTIRR